jgi:hypothetical protein
MNVVPLRCGCEARPSEARAAEAARRRGSKLIGQLCLHLMRVLAARPRGLSTLASKAENHRRCGGLACVEPLCAKLTYEAKQIEARRHAKRAASARDRYTCDHSTHEHHPNAAHGRDQ